MEAREVEVRFLDINVDQLTARLAQANAHDLGEKLLEEVIFYDSELHWRDEHRLIRLRKAGDTTTLTYKHHQAQTLGGAVEIELEVSDLKKAEALLEKTGLVAYRHQQKKRWTFQLGDVTVDIDTWPKIPPYVELEGLSEASLKIAAQHLGLSWSDAVFDDAKRVIERYGVPVGSMRWFTFDRVE